MVVEHVSEDARFLKFVGRLITATIKLIKKL
jgi:hypothetical protein